MSEPTAFHQPLGGNEMPRFGGIASMMRLPVASSAVGLNAGFIGVPLDIGTSHRPGARFGPRQIRAESCLIRPYNMATGAAPFDALQVADLGDVPINTYHLLKSVDIIEQHYKPIIDAGFKAAMEVFAEHEAKSPEFKKIHQDMRAFQRDQLLWGRFSENAYNSYMGTVKI